MTKVQRCSLLILGALALIPLSANAVVYESRLSWGACHQSSTGPLVILDGSNTSTTGTGVLICPITDTTDIPHASITTMNFHVEDNHSSLSVRAFRIATFFNAVGGAIGDHAVSANGVTSISPPNSPATLANAWNNAANFASVMVFLPPTQGTASRIKGYYLFKP
jgi:hypothetical protein